MTQQNETQEQERLRTIRQRWTATPYRPPFKTCKDDIDFLLSLLDTRAPVDSQEAGTFSLNEGGMVRSISATSPEAAITMGHIIAHNRNAAFRLGATQMRTACVEKVKEMQSAIRKRNYDRDESNRLDAYRINLLDEVVAQLSSLTLDQVKQKEQSK